MNGLEIPSELTEIVKRYADKHAMQQVWEYRNRVLRLSDLVREHMQAGSTSPLRDAIENREMVAAVKTLHQISGVGLSECKLVIDLMFDMP